MQHIERPGRGSALVRQAFALTPVLGFYLGLWVRGRTKSALVLMLYIALTLIYALDIVPGSLFSSGTQNTPDALAAALWFVAAFVLRSQVMRYYGERESVPFRVKSILPALSSVRYINGLQLQPRS